MPARDREPSPERSRPFLLPLSPRYSNLLPGGYLFLGQTESLFQVDESFRLVHFPRTTAYWKPTSAQAAEAQK